MPAHPKAPASPPEERFRVLLEGNACPMWVFDPETLSFLALNEAAVRLYGYSREELLSMTIKDIHPSEDIARLLAVMGGLPDRFYEGIWRHVKQGGASIQVAVTTNRIDWAGRPAQMVVVRDVTQPVAVERALRETEERFRLVSRATNDVVWDWNLQTNDIWGSDSSTKILGYSPEEVSQGPSWWAERIHPDDRTRVIAGYEEALARGESVWSDEYRFLRADGVYLHINDRAFVIRDRDGKPLRMLGAMTDITRRKEAEAALARAEEKYRSIFENAVEGIGQTTPEGRFLTANPALAHMLGYDSPEDLIASVTDAAHIYVEPGTREQIAHTLEKEGAIRGIEVQVRRRDGTPIWLLMNLRAVRDQQGRIEHYDGIAQDVSARKKSEDALREVSGLLLQSQNEERRRIARELHDSTAQSLAALAMNLSMIGKTAGGLSAATRRKLRDSLELAQQCCREARTLSYLLHPPALEEGDLWSAVRWYTEGFSNRSGIRVDLTLPGANQAGRLPQQVETTLFRVIQESLANIHRHSGSRQARISIARSPSRVTLVVRDQGRGMRTVMGQRLRGPVLLGVGIAGMRERVRQLGGELQIDSNTRGTAVKVMLPLPREQ